MDGDDECGARRRQPCADRRLPGRSISIWEVAGKVATVTLNRPERKNPLTFDRYAELRDLFRALEARARRAARRRSPGAGEQFLLRRRRARDHRPADAELRHAGPARLHRA